MVDILVLGERQLMVRAVYAGARRVDEMRDLRVATSLDDVAERGQIVGEVRSGIDERITNARLRRQVNDLPERTVAKQAARRNRQPRDRSARTGIPGAR